MIMNKRITLWERYVLSKLMLVATLFILGGNLAMAEEVIFDSDNQSITDGWTFTKVGNNNTIITGSLSSATNYNLNNYNSSAGSEAWYTSSTRHIINNGQKIEITAIKYGSSNQNGSIKVQYSTDGSTWNTSQTISLTDYSNYNTFTEENINGTYYLRFEFLYCKISRIILKDATNAPILSVVHPDNGDSFGFVKESTSKTYTVTNTGIGSMDVVISSSDPAFSVSDNELTSITNDGTGKTFDVTFNYDSNNPGQHSANIIVSPTLEGAVPYTFTVTAGPDAEFNEDKETTWTTGSGKSVYVKYTAYDGWNTICFPLSPSSYKNNLFGSSATVKYYKLASYADGILTFENVSYPSSNTPYLVNVQNAASTNFVIENVHIGYTSPGKAGNGGATFQGTYAPIDMEGKYGVTGKGTIQKGGAGSNMPGYRAYFTGVSAPADGARPTIVFSEEEMPTGIGAVQLLENTKDVYNLNGQKVAQTRKGIYIVNGRKIVVK